MNAVMWTVLLVIVGALGGTSPRDGEMERGRVRADSPSVLLSLSPSGYWNNATI